MRRFRLLGLAAALPILASGALPGCGGAHDSGLFGADGDDSTTVDSGASDAKGGGGDDAGGSDSGHDGAAPRDSGAHLDAGTSDSGGDTRDADGAEKMVPCGQGPSCTTTQGCCVSYPLVGGPSYQCGQSAFGNCMPLITCHSKDDCADGEVCCGILAFGTARYSSMQCAKTCDLSNTSNIRFCDSAASNDECQDVNLRCSASTVLSGYSRCGN